MDRNYNRLAKYLAPEAKWPDEPDCSLRRTTTKKRKSVVVESSSSSSSSSSEEELQMIRLSQKVSSTTNPKAAKTKTSGIPMKKKKKTSAKAKGKGILKDKILKGKPVSPKTLSAIAALDTIPKIGSSTSTAARPTRQNSQVEPDIYQKRKMEVEKHRKRIRVENELRDLESDPESIPLDVLNDDSEDLTSNSEGE